MSKIVRALISVSDKTGIVDFARVLVGRSIEILSTGGTAKALKSAGILVVEVSDYTGSPEILDGRLKTLHPKIHGGLLGMRGNPEHVQQMADNGIGPIDLVVVNLYPFEQTIAKTSCTLAEAMENIDIGGPTMLRAAAKNWQDVAVVVDPADYTMIVEELEKNKGTISRDTLFHLAQKVFAHTARYDAAITTHLSTYDSPERRLELPRTFGFVVEQVQPLRYGENPHQRAAFYRDNSVGAGLKPAPTEPSLVNALQLQGKELSYNNIMDTDGAMNVVKEFVDAPYVAVIVKHANPCGVAVSTISLADAFARARAADPTSAFGGVVALNRMLDAATAHEIGDTFFEVIAASDVDPQALEILGKKKNLRILKVPGLGQPFVPTGWNLRKVAGGLLIQDRDVSREDIRAANVVTKRQPTDAEWLGLLFAWRVVKHVKSNAIVLAGKDQTLGVGAGQMSRVDAVKMAVMKWQGEGDVVLASDAFFPFRDGVDTAAKAGVTAIIQPGGSVRDEEVIAAANEKNVAMVFTGARHFLH